jgi:hypothetical protein
MPEKPAHYKPNGKKAPGARRKRSNQPRALAGEKMTPKRWETYIAALANGKRHRDAAHEAKISVRTVDAYLISNVAASQQVRDAKMLWNRREWPMHKIEELLEQIAMGCTVKEAARKCGIDEAQLPSLYRVLLIDKAIRKLYDEARELGAEVMADDIIDISDDREADRDEEGKPNHEVINRSRLRVDTRKWLMGKHVARRFGDTKHHVHEGELNINHAAILSGGRRRLEQLQQKRSKATIDNDTQEVVSND